MKITIMLLILLLPLSAVTVEELDLVIDKKDTVVVVIAKDEEYRDNDSALTVLAFVVITILTLHLVKQ